VTRLFTSGSGFALRRELLLTDAPKFVVCLSKVRGSSSYLQYPIAPSIHLFVVFV